MTMSAAELAVTWAAIAAKSTKQNLVIMDYANAFECAYIAEQNGGADEAITETGPGKQQAGTERNPG